MNVFKGGVGQSITGHLLIVMLMCWILHKNTTTVQSPIFSGVDTNWRCHITLHKLSMDIRGICINIALHNSSHCFHDEDGSKALTVQSSLSFERKCGYSCSLPLAAGVISPCTKDVSVFLVFTMKMISQS